MSNPRREAMLARIQDWHDNDEHQNILAEINKIPREFWDYKITCLYARALNNVEQYEEALELLMDVRTQGRNDGFWYFSTGYSLYYLGREAEAAECIQKAIDMGNDSEDAGKLLKACHREAEQKKNIAGAYDPLLYSEREMSAIERHIEKHFGSYRNVFHEIASPDIHVDIVIIEPTPKRNYYVLVTLGMGARKMNIPAELEEYKLERVELMVCLPPDWNLNDLEEEKWYWPLRWLKILARLPGEKNTWLGCGHTIPNGGPFAENTRLSAVMLIAPGAFGKNSCVCKLPGGDEVNFYQMLPLYDEEIEFKLRNSAEALLELMDDRELEYVRLDRKSVVRG